jgi:hypothetical protein
VQATSILKSHSSIGLRVRRHILSEASFNACSKNRVKHVLDPSLLCGFTAKSIFCGVVLTFAKPNRRLPCVTGGQSSAVDTKRQSRSTCEPRR